MMTILPLLAWAELPIFFPSAYYIDEDGTEVKIEESITHEAPLTVFFQANPEHAEGRNITYEWHFRKTNEETDYLIRYDQDIEYTFMDAGTTIAYFRAYENSVLIGEGEFSITITTSKLTMPNAFTPNGDSRNDTYRPLTHESLTEFHAYIYNRWGQLLYDWTDPDAEGWDGTYKGKPVKEGVYFVLVKAKGSDGVNYSIKKDVNLLRGYTEYDSDPTY